MRFLRFSLFSGVVALLVQAPGYSSDSPSCVNFDLSGEMSLLTFEPGTSKTALTAFSADRKRLVVVDPTGVTSFEIASGKKKKLSAKDVYLTAQSPDGKILEVLNPKTHELTIWDVEKNKKTKGKYQPSTAKTQSESSVESATKAVSPNGQSAAVLTGEEIQLADTVSGKTRGVSIAVRDLQDLKFLDNERILVQTGTELKVISPAALCVNRARIADSDSCATCQVPSTTVSSVDNLEAIHRTRLCDSEYHRADWAKNSDIPASGVYSREQIKRVLQELAKPGAFVPEKHLPVFMGALETGLGKEDPDLVYHAFAGVLTTHPKLFEQLVKKYSVFDDLRPRGQKACRSEKENKKVQQALQNYINSADAIALGRDLDSKKRTAQPAPKFFLTVGSEIKKNQTRSWAEQKCKMLYDKVQIVTDQPVDTACAAEHVDPNLSQTIQRMQVSGKYGYQVGFHEKADGTVDFKVIDWKEKTDRPLGERYKFTLSDPKQAEQTTQRFVKQVVKFDKNRRVVEELALLNGLKLSKRLKINPETGEYFDRQTSKKVQFEEAYKIFQQEDPKQKNYLLAATEISLILGSAMIDYYMPSAQENVNATDWQFTFWESLRKKVLSTEGMRFDDNRASVNIGHALAGTGYYLPCRTNNLTAMESFGCAILASYFWEVFGEYREIWGINDMIITPIGGVAIGEPLYQHGHFFNRGSGTLLNKFGIAIFGGFEAVNNWFNGTKTQRAEEVDKFGFPTDVWHQFQLSGGYALQSRSDTKGDQSAPSVALETQILNQTTYDKEGKTTEVFRDTLYSKIKSRFTMSPDEVQELEVMTKAVLAGYYKQNTKLDEKSKLSGYSFFIGPATGVDLRQQSIGGVRKDMVATVNVLGSTIDVTGYKNGVRMRFTLDVFGDFAMVRSYAIDDYAKENGRDGLPSVLKLRDYYYAGGVTSAAAASVSYKDLELTAEYKKQYLKGIDGSDRFQESIARPIRKNDDLTSAKLGLAYKITDNIRIKTSAEWLERRSFLDRYSKGVKTKRYLGELEFLF